MPHGGLKGVKLVKWENQWELAIHLWYFPLSTAITTLWIAPHTEYKLRNVKSKAEEGRKGEGSKPSFQDSKLSSNDFPL